MNEGKIIFPWACMAEFLDGVWEKLFCFGKWLLVVWFWELQVSICMVMVHDEQLSVVSSL